MNATTPGAARPAGVSTSGGSADASAGSSATTSTVELPQHTGQLQTPALVVEFDALHSNVEAMAAELPGARLRPHVKAHKTTALARMQYDAGHHAFTCATLREVEGMVAAGLGEDLLLANEVLDAGRLTPLLAAGARITCAVDSKPTLDAAVSAGVPEVVIDVNVGLPRCGCPPEQAGDLARAARAAGLTVRGVMGYEGHLMMAPEADKPGYVKDAMALLLRAAADVGGAGGGELITAGGTGTFAVNTWANEIQAGSYVLMDTAYTQQESPFVQALWVLGTVISVSPDYAVVDVGLKALGMDHGNPAIDGAAVWFCSDEHTTFAPEAPGSVSVGDRVRVTPAHIDPTVALHEAMYPVRGEQVLDRWAVDLRGW